MIPIHWSRIQTTKKMWYIWICGGIMENRSCAFLIRMPMASIRDSVEISNMFYIYIGLLVIMISSGAIWFMSKRITKPLLELTEISRRMSNLDFEARYEGGG